MASNAQHEPTMEEILASIRKIISEDSTEAPAAPAAVPMAAAPAPVPEAKEEEPDVLELTQEIPEPPPAAPMVQAAPEPAPKVEDDVVFQTIEETQVTPSGPSEIFSDKTRKAIDDTFSKLDDVPTPEPSAPKFMPKPATVEGNSVEAVFERAVRDAVGPHIDQWMSGQKDDLLAAMKPLIRDWMDEHFPALLEGAVRDEVSRVLKARGQR